MPPLDFTPAEVSIYYEHRLPKLNQRGSEWRGPCPVHKGKRDSFAVNAETGAAYCHSECSRGWSIVELERELYGGTKRQAVIVETYDYTDEDGKLLYQVVRYEPKDFRQRRPNGKGGWTWSVKGVRQVPYRLPKVLGSERVFVVEGERDVHTLEQLGYVATCNAGGAGKWRDEFARYLAGKDVVILPDNDGPGEVHAQQVKRSLHGNAASVRIVRLPKLPTKGDVTDWVQAGGSKEKLEELLQQTEPEQEDPADREPPTSQLWRVDEDGLWCVDPRGEQKDLWCAPPFDVVAGTLDLNDGNRGKLVEFTDATGRRRQAIIPHVKLVADGNDALEELIYLGFKPNRMRRARERVKDYIWFCEPKRSIRCVSQVGWHRGCFVLPDRTITPPGQSTEIIFQTPDLQVENRIRQSGTLEQWKQHVARYCPGNSRLLFCVSAAFAAALLSPMQHEGTGFHLRGQSSTGKTTALRIAGSVWGGGGETGFVDTWRSTANGIEGKAAFHNHALLCLDEISQADEKDIGQVIYLLANGYPKNRMTKRITMARAIQFRLIYLSTGERSFYEMMTAAGKRPKGGQLLRLNDIPADAGAGMGMFEELHDTPSPDQLARILTNSSSAYYGTPIIAFLERLVAGLADARDYAKGLQQDFISACVPADASGEVVRVARAFALVAAAGELATRYGVTGWPKRSAAKAALRCFADWLAERGSTGALDIEYGIRRVRDFIAQHGSSRFQDIDHKESGTPIRDRAGFKELTGPSDTGEVYTFYVHESVFINEICGSYDYRAVYREMVKRGYAYTQKGKHLAVRKRIPNYGQPRFFVVLPTIFEEDE